MFVSVHCNYVSLTANASENLCGSNMVEFTCKIYNVLDPVLRWFHDGMEIRELTHRPYSTNNYPLQLDVSSLEGILDYTIISAEFSEDRTMINFTAVVVVDLEIIINNLGYHSLQCGTFFIRDNFTLTQGLFTLK